MNCIFCNIINKQSPATILFEDEEVVIIKNIHPKTPIHLLAIPKKHIDSVSSLTDEDAETMGKLIVRVAKFGKGHFPEGYRFAVNVDEHGGQTVRHIHIHILAGKKFEE